jgi:carboxymethylenebutenolidase
MERKAASEFDPELLNLFDQYVHGKITRCGFMDGAAKFSVGGLTAAAIFESLAPNYALAQQISPGDSRIKTEYIHYPSPQGTAANIHAYLVQLAVAHGKLPGVLVVHENRGLNPYIEDVARRLGVAGYLALAPDGLTSVGGYPGDDDKGRELQASWTTAN